MNKPYIDSIITKSDSKYLLIVAARQITLTEPELTRSGKINPVSAALHEINDDELSWEIGQPLAAEEAEAALPEDETVSEEPAEVLEAADIAEEAAETLVD